MVRVRNASKVVVAVAGRYLTPGQSLEIPDNHWQGWLAQASAHQRIANTHLAIGDAEGPAEPPEEAKPERTRPAEPGPDWTPLDDQTPPFDETKPPSGDTKAPPTDPPPPPGETKAPASETAKPAAAPPAPPADDIDPDKVDQALRAFDHDDNSLWTEAGLPQVPALQKATGLKGLRARHRDAAVGRTGITRKQ